MVNLECTQAIWINKMGGCKLPVGLSISLFLFVFLVVVGCSEKESLIHHELDVASLVREVNSPPVQIYGKEKEEMVSPWSLPVFHRDGLLMGNVSYQQRIKERLERDSERVKALSKRIDNHGKVKVKERIVPSDFGGDVVSGLPEGLAEYLVRIGVGTPPEMQYFFLDTGSDVTWLQCEPCSHCYDQVDPIFDPSFSTSFATIPCSSQLCSELGISRCDKNWCLYGVAYGDGSFTVGRLVKETLTFGRTRVKNVAIGCGEDNEGLFVGAGGLLGLGGGPLSFPTQLGSLATPFSYCLVDRDSDDKGTLHFGPGAVSQGGSIFTPLLRNPVASTFYYVSITSITVGRVTVGLPKSVSRFDQNGKGGIIVDSGTTITRLQKKSYQPFQHAFLAATKDLPRAKAYSIFDACYDLSGIQKVRLPIINFHFSNGVSLTLPVKNSLIAVDTKGTFCLAFAPTSNSLSIIGNFQQQGFRISFDSANSLLGFAPNQC